MTLNLTKSRERALQAALISNGWDRKIRGILHTRITRFLPEFVDNGDKCANLRRLSIALDMSYQGVYKWMRPNRPNRITPQVAQMLVELSKLTDRKSSKVPENWRPATIEDFWEFVAS